MKSIEKRIFSPRVGDGQRKRERDANGIAGAERGWLFRRPFRERRSQADGEIYKSVTGLAPRALSPCRNKRINSFSESYTHFSRRPGRPKKESSKKKRGSTFPAAEYVPNVTNARFSFPSLRFCLTAGHEQHDKDSLNETGSTTGGTVEGAPSGGPSGRGDRSKDKEERTSPHASTSAQPARSLVSKILSRARSPDDLLDHSEP